ncbi:pantoate--beta-alanine ligase [soil metagenome]
METVTTVAGLRRRLDGVRAEGRAVGLVPTMGALHDGHLSLVRRSAEENDVTVVSLFVNPLQFGEGEDLAAYPRDAEGDTALAARAGAEVLFAPSVAEMYPEPVRTTVSVAGVATGMEGEARPTHFDGVATVVAKLFAIAGRCSAYFGEKDYQQLCVVRRLAADLSFPARVVGCATVRERDGLALSSRNAYLTADEREAAPVLHTALRSGLATIMAGERDPMVVRELVAAIIEAEPLADLDYAEVRDGLTLEPLAAIADDGGEVRLLAAARFGRARLLDNVGYTP